MGGLSGSGGLGGLIRPRMSYGDEEDDEELDEDEDEDPDYEEDVDAPHAVTLQNADTKTQGKKSKNNNGDDQVKVAIDEAPMDEEDSSSGNGQSKQIVLNLDDFLKNNGSLTRDENGMTYIQGHILSEVLESLVHKRQGTDKNVQSDEQVKDESENDKEK
ncbi:hypothetical protein ACO0QE_004268 [Hanseniaspora vineae]